MEGVRFVTCPVIETDSVVTISNSANMSTYLLQKSHGVVNMFTISYIST